MDIKKYKYKFIKSCGITNIIYQRKKLKDIYKAKKQNFFQNFLLVIRAERGQVRSGGVNCLFLENLNLTLPF